MHNEMLKKIILIFVMTMFLIGTVTADYAYASGVGEGVKTLAEVAAASAGTAVLGSSALGVIVPVLCAVGAAYAGYKIYQHREDIWTALKTWADARANVTCTFLAEFVALFDKGEIADGTTISIPKDVLMETKGFMEDFNAKYATKTLEIWDGKTVGLNELAYKFESIPVLHDMMERKTFQYDMPILILRDITKGDVRIYTVGTYIGRYDSLLLIRNGGYLVPAIYDRIDLETYTLTYSGNSSTFNLLNYTARNDEVSDYYLDRVYPNLVVFEDYTEDDISFVNNHVNAPVWRYDLEIIVPSDCNVYITNTIYNPGGVLDRHSIDKIVSGGQVLVPVDNPLEGISKPYLPSIDNIDGVDALPITLTQDVILGLDDYLVAGKTDSIDLVNVLDPAADVDSTYVTDYKDAVAGYTAIEGSINDNFAGAWDNINLDFFMPEYIMSALTFVGYCFSGIWSGFDDYIYVIIFGITIGLVALIVGRGIVRASDSAKSSGKSKGDSGGGGKKK